MAVFLAAKNIGDNRTGLAPTVVELSGASGSVPQFECSSIV
jgi:hypothetical protein